VGWNRVIAAVAGNRKDHKENFHTGSTRIDAGLGIKVKSQDLTTERKRRKQLAFDGNGNQRSYLPANRQAGY
jgi:hypothetical protein